MGKYVNFTVSSQVVGDLSSVGAEKFRRGSYSRIERVYLDLCSKVFTGYENVLYLNAYILIAAIDSAYLDLRRSDTFHDFSDGPSFLKRGAALACWINKLKPVQILGCDEGLDEDVYHFNSILALEVGIRIVWISDVMKILEKNLSVSEGVLSAAEGVLLSSVDGCHLGERSEKNVKEMLYTLCWRSPDFKTLTTFFKLMENPWLHA